MASKANAKILPVSVRGASNVWTNILRGVRSRIYINIGKPYGPIKIDGIRKEKDQKIDEASRILMCRIAALLPKKKHGCFSDDPRISTYQIENGLNII